MKLRTLINWTIISALGYYFLKVCLGVNFNLKLIIDKNNNGIKKIGDMIQYKGDKNNTQKLLTDRIEIVTDDTSTTSSSVDTDKMINTKKNNSINKDKEINDGTFNKIKNKLSTINSSIKNKLNTEELDRELDKELDTDSELESGSELETDSDINVSDLEAELEIESESDIESKKKDLMAEIISDSGTDYDSDDVKSIEGYQSQDNFEKLF